jgi:YHS domain-containing protein
MKLSLSLLAAGLLLSSLAGCSPDKADNNAAPANSPSSSTAQTPVTKAAVVEGAPEGSIKVGDTAVCVICATNAGKPTDPEPVKEVINYKGKTYAFCNESEKAEFISNPAKYAGK